LAVSLPLALSSQTRLSPGTTRNALTALSDRELEDIGMSRADIDAVVAGKTAY